MQAFLYDSTRRACLVSPVPRLRWSGLPYGGTDPVGETLSVRVKPNPPNVASSSIPIVPVITGQKTRTTQHLAKITHAGVVKPGGPLRLWSSRPSMRYFTAQGGRTGGTLERPQIYAPLIIFSGKRALEGVP